MQLKISRDTLTCCWDVRQPTNNESRDLRVVVVNLMDFSVHTASVEGGGGEGGGDSAVVRVLVSFYGSQAHTVTGEK